MAEEGCQQAEIEAALSKWRQGDFVLMDCGFLAAIESNGAEGVEAGIDKAVNGLAVVSQTCDIVRLQSDRPFVNMCPLVERNQHVARDVARGRKPNLFEIEGAPENLFADISRMMSIKKEILANWPRRDGFMSDQGRKRFGAALERKFGRFAFPDAFDLAPPFRSEVQHR